MIKLTTIQTAWAVTKAQALAHLHITSTDEDTYVESFLIKAAQEACENFTGRKFNDGKYDYYLDEFPNGADLAGVIYLPYSPAKALDASYDFIVKYYNTSDVETTLTQDTDYRSDIIHSPPRVVPIDSWVETYDKINAVKISFQTGYTSPDFIPVAAIEAMYLLIGDMYLHREDSVRRFPTAVQRLLMPLRVWV